MSEDFDAVCDTNWPNCEDCPIEFYCTWAEEAYGDDEKAYGDEISERETGLLLLLVALLVLLFVEIYGVLMI